MFCIDLSSGIKYKITQSGVNFRRLQSNDNNESYWFTLGEFQQYFKVLH